MNIWWLVKEIWRLCRSTVLKHFAASLVNEIHIKFAVSVSIGSFSAVSDLNQDGVRLFRIINFTILFCEFQVTIFV